MATLLPARPAVAGDGPLVVILHPAAADPLTGEALARMRGELTSSGFAVQTLAPPAGGDLLAAVEEIARAAAPVAIFALRKGIEEGRVEVWIVDRTTGATQVRAIDLRGAPPDRAPAVLAVRAAEQLRSVLDGLAARARLQAEARAAEGARRAAARAGVEAARAAAEGAGVPPASIFALGVGALGAGGVGGVSPTIAPGVSALVLGPRRLFGRLAAAGFGSRAAIETDEGSGRLSTLIALAEAGARLPLAVRGDALVGLCGGAVRVMGSGAPAEGFVGREDGLWAVAGGAAAGALWRPWRHLWLFLDARALWLTPAPRVAIAGVAAGRLGAPLLAIGAGIAFSP